MFALIFPRRVEMFAHQCWSENVQTLIERHGYGPAFLIAGALPPLAFLVISRQPHSLQYCLFYYGMNAYHLPAFCVGVMEHYGGNVVSGEMGFHLSHPMGKGETLSAAAKGSAVTTVS